MTISQRVFYLLDKQGKKQNQLSKFTGISTSTISAWNKRGTDPAAENISAIAGFFKVSTDYILTGKEKNSPTQELSTDEQRLLHMYSLLSDMEKGEILGELKAITSNRESIKKNDNLQTVLIAARSSDHHPPELVTGDFSDIINAPDATDEY